MQVSRSKVRVLAGSAGSTAVMEGFGSARGLGNPSTARISSACDTIPLRVPVRSGPTSSLNRRYAFASKESHWLVVI